MSDTFSTEIYVTRTDMLNAWMAAAIKFVSHEQSSVFDYAEAAARH
jgi:hypothetical protein